MSAIRYDFTPPHIVGALGDESLDPQFARACERMLRDRGINAACLSFRVAPRHLRNVVACMRLIDVAALVVHDAHSRRITRFLPRMDAAARAMGAADMVIRHGASFMGSHSWTRALASLIDKRRGKITIVGTGHKARVAATLLKHRHSRRLRSLDRTRADRFPADTIVIDLRESSAATRLSGAVTQAIIEKTATEIRIETLAQSCRTR